MDQRSWAPHPQSKNAQRKIKLFEFNYFTFFTTHFYTFYNYNIYLKYIFGTLTIFLNISPLFSNYYVCSFYSFFFRFLLFLYFTIL